MILEANASHYTPIEWGDAFQRIASSIDSMDSPERGVYYTSGRTSNEAAFLYQALVRALGTNNMPDCSNMCHESSGKALIQTIGIGKGTVHLEDFNHSDLIRYRSKSWDESSANVDCIARCKEKGCENHQH